MLVALTSPRLMYPTFTTWALSRVDLSVLSWRWPSWHCQGRAVALTIYQPATSRTAQRAGLSVLFDALHSIFVCP
jgi:hypothetical protein